jgi:16S rRNA (guanine966-N2)-methyltransferase
VLIRVVWWIVFFLEAIRPICHLRNLCHLRIVLVLRIIAGKYRGRNLKSPPSLEVRPTSDRLRETLFNVIAPRIEGARFLDLCAGSGAVGIEALSRNASHVTFVDRSRKMCGLVEANLDLCRVPEDETEVVQSEALDFLRRRQARQKNEPWDIVFFDPPYATDYLRVLESFGAETSNLLTESGLLIVEHHHKNQLPDEVGRLARARTLKQGDSALSFYEVSA